MKWTFEGLGEAWRGRYAYGYTEPETYVLISQKWVLYWNGIKIWTKWKAVGEIDLNQYLAHAPFGEAKFNCDHNVILVDGAKVGFRMKKRKNFFQVFLFSYILQGFHGTKKAGFYPRLVSFCAC